MVNAPPGADAPEGGGESASWESASVEAESDSESEAVRVWVLEGAAGEGEVVDRWEEGREDDGELVLDEEAGGGAEETCSGCFVDHLRRQDVVEFV